MKTEIEEAINYFEGAGFIEELTTDKKYYVQVMIDELKSQKNRIKVFWNLEDIKGLDSSLTEKDLREIAEKIERTHDAECGINWDVLKDYIQQHKLKK